MRNSCEMGRIGMSNGQMGIFDQLPEGDLLEAAVVFCKTAAVRRLGAGKAPEVSLEKKQKAPGFSQAFHRVRLRFPWCF